MQRVDVAQPNVASVAPAEQPRPRDGGVHADAPCVLARSSAEDGRAEAVNAHVLTPERGECDDESAGEHAFFRPHEADEADLSLPPASAGADVYSAAVDRRFYAAPAGGAPHAKVTEHLRALDLLEGRGNAAALRGGEATRPPPRPPEERQPGEQERRNVATPRRKRRPPTLSALDTQPWGGASADVEEHEFVFASDGCFHDGGFHIGPHGIQAAPRPDAEASATTRTAGLRGLNEDEAYGDVPSSRRLTWLVGHSNELELLSTLGYGNAGVVKLARHAPSGRYLAVKVVNVLHAERREQLLRELSLLNRHDSRFLVRFYGAFYNGAGAVHLAEEYMECGSLHEAIRRVPLSGGGGGGGNGGGECEQYAAEKVAAVLARHCLRGLDYLHRRGTLHRDVKPANVLLSLSLQRAKLADFGLVRRVDADDQPRTFVGTMAYMSPERLAGMEYTQASDVWALGMSLVESVLGRYPHGKAKSFFDYGANASTSLEAHVQSFSAPMRDFVRLCTASDARRRPSAAALLEHTWLTEGDARAQHLLFVRWLQRVKNAMARQDSSFVL